MAVAEPGGPNVRGSDRDYKRVGLAFAKALATRDYDVAYALTARDYRDSTTLKALQAAFESIVPVVWKSAGPIEIGQTMEDWPGREPSDVGWRT